mgnify:CR=1 FL=1
MNQCVNKHKPSHNSNLANIYIELQNKTHDMKNLPDGDMFIHYIDILFYRIFNILKHSNKNASQEELYNDLLTNFPNIHSNYDFLDENITSKDIYKLICNNFNYEHCEDKSLLRLYLLTIICKYILQLHNYDLLTNPVDFFTPELKENLLIRDSPSGYRRFWITFVNYYHNTSATIENIKYVIKHTLLNLDVNLSIWF